VDGDYSVEILAPKELMAEMKARCRSGPPDERPEDQDLDMKKADEISSEWSEYTELREN
jgi:hypothetical protein